MIDTAAHWTLILGSRNYSSWSLRAWLVLTHAGAEFDELVIALDQLDTPALLQRHSPTRRVPILRAGDLTVWDSLAIAELVAETFPAKQLWPVDPSARAMARAVTCEMHSGFPALREHMPFNVRRRSPGKGRAPGVAEDIARVTAIWRECRERFGAGGQMLFGRFTIADAFYAPVVSRFTTYAVDVDEVCSRYMDAVWALPSMQAWRAAAVAEPDVSPKYDL